MAQDLAALLAEIRACRVCADALGFAPRPIVVAARTAKVLIIGQAPGSRVHASGQPWDDDSGDRLRGWLAMDRATFYDADKVAQMPSGFCYPGKGKGGDLPPRPECAPLWHAQLLATMPHIRLTLLIGRYAQAYYLRGNAKPTLTETVAAYADYLPHFLPLPHPSPRNRLWLRRNPWFEAEVVPRLRQQLAMALAD